MNYGCFKQIIIVNYFSYCFESTFWKISGIMQTVENTNFLAIGVAVHEKKISWNCVSFS